MTVLLLTYHVHNIQYSGKATTLIGEIAPKWGYNNAKLLQSKIYNLMTTANKFYDATVFRSKRFSQALIITLNVTGSVIFNSLKLHIPAEKDLFQ